MLSTSTPQRCPRLTADALDLLAVWQHPETLTRRALALVEELGLDHALAAMAAAAEMRLQLAEQEGEES